MKYAVINWCINKANKDKKYNEEELEILEYGLVSIYLLITKLIVIFALCIILGIFKEAIIFITLYNIIRMPSFGLHATKSWICLLSSTIIFVGIPLIIPKLILSIPYKYALGILGIISMALFSPADTHKRPIINKTRRKVYKLISVLLAIIFTILSITINNNFISNCLIFSLILQSFIISPFIYKIFNLPFDNYKRYSKNMV